MSVPKLKKLPEPRNLGALKAEVERRWGTIDLLDILKDTAFITDFTDSFASVEGPQGGVVQAGVERFQVLPPAAQSPHGGQQVPGLGGADHDPPVHCLGDGRGWSTGCGRPGWRAGDPFSWLVPG